MPVVEAIGGGVAPLLHWPRVPTLSCNSLILRHSHTLATLSLPPTQIPPCVVTEYCSRGSLADVLKAAHQSTSMAARLDWSRRIRMVRPQPL